MFCVLILNMSGSTYKLRRFRKPDNLNLRNFFMAILLRVTQGLCQKSAKSRRRNIQILFSLSGLKRSLTTSTVAY